VTDEERLAEIEEEYGWADSDSNVHWLIDRVRALMAERDELIVERDAWRTRVTG
jgi:hypothetical protein